MCGWLFLQHEAKWTKNAIEFFNEAAEQGGTEMLSTAADNKQDDSAVRVEAHILTASSSIVSISQPVLAARC